MSIFVDHDWITGTQDKTIEKERFKRFCELLLHLSEDERHLFLQLTSRYLHCPVGAYPPLLRQALDKIPPSAYEDRSQVYVVPLIAPRDRGRDKSSQTVAYLATAYAHTHPALRRIARGPKPSDHWNLKVLYPERPKPLVIFFDDFIGSGETAIDAIESYKTEVALPNEKAIVVSLVAQSEGIANIQSKNIEVYAALMRPKGISEAQDLGDVGRAKELMAELEQRIGIEQKYYFGYAKSEALVTMAKTPNNTFPLFWVGELIDGSKWPAPFERPK